MSKVEDFFITPLEAHYDCQPKEGPRGTIMEDMEFATPEQLHEAAEWIKRNKQSVTSFPSPKECNAALAAVIERKVPNVVAKGEKVSKDNFAALSVAYCKANNVRGDPFIVSKTDGSWEDWIAYFRSIDMEFVAGIMSERDRWTVPSLFPSQFDPSFKMGGKSA